VSDDLHLRVFGSRSELHWPDGRVEVFEEGKQSEAARKRGEQIDRALEQGFLREQIILCKEEPEALLLDEVSEADQLLLKGVADMVSSERGRGIAGLMVLQLAVKAICPAQSIRLHKSKRGFSWVEGIPMRSIDKSHFTPVLREHDLLRMNADGYMMTRSLAENYPYTAAYKPHMRGAKKEWLALVERIEAADDPLPALPALQFLLGQLVNRANTLKELGEQAVEALAWESVAAAEPFGLIWDHIKTSAYSARLLEVAMHALLQALEAEGCLGLQLVPLSQMRSANKKHGNVGDVELTGMADQIIEAWDAKYGKPDLREELGELDEKLADHPSVDVAGFVYTDRLEQRQAVELKAAELGKRHGAEVALVRFDEWVERQLDRCPESRQAVTSEWLVAYTESLAQRRRETAPIDEPTLEWLREWMEILRRC
jgi:hypothetical protein